MRLTTNYPLLIAAVIIGGCVNNPDIQNGSLNDRVKACSAGFSESTQAGLHAALNKAALSGGLDGNVKEETRSLIFDSIPPQDREKAYKDYIGCIEKNWNQ